MFNFSVQLNKKPLKYNLHNVFHYKPTPHSLNNYIGNYYIFIIDQLVEKQNY